MHLEWLGQLRFQTFQTLVPPHWFVQAHRLVNNRWVPLSEFDRSFPDSNYVGAYFDQLCAAGRWLGLPKPASYLRIFAPRAPVIVRMLAVDHLGVWTVRQECNK